MKTKFRSRRVERMFARVCAKYGLKPGKCTKEDFFRICRGENIKIANWEELRWFAEDRNSILGFYAQLFGAKRGRFIYLRSFFKKRFDRHTAFHELGHHFMKHQHGFRFQLTGEFHGATIPKNETEADYFAELATNLKRRVC